MRSRLIRSHAGALCVVSLLLGMITPAAVAAGRCPRTSELAVEQQVMCLVCGIPLALADSPQADRERAFIAALVDRCQGADQIKAALVAQYGPGVLSLPPARGFALGLYLVPAIGLPLALVGIAVVVLRPRRRPRRPVQGPALLGPPPTDVELARLSSELARDQLRP